MKIVFYDFFNEGETNGEAELMLRIRYSMERCGHIFLLADRDGYIKTACADRGKHAESVGADIICTCISLVLGLIALPDMFSVFMHWSPLGWFNSSQALMETQYWHSFDYFSCTGEAEDMSRILGGEPSAPPLTGTSSPADFAVPPRRMTQRKLFYIGINYERVLKNMRFGELLGKLDKTGQLEIYGPRKVYGRENLWAGFSSYCGEIPFDGRSVIKKINQAGVCLALNSPFHNDANMVSARTYEGAAAGAVIISDDNEFVHRYFGDSVFYIDSDLSEEEASAKVMEILRWVNDHPDEAYDMACRSQKAFLENLTLERMINDQVNAVQRQIEHVYDRSAQTDVIDVVCFVDEQEDYDIILAQLKRQYYQNLHLIVVCSEDIAGRADAPYPCDYVIGSRNERGSAFVRARQLLRGPYFMFMDRESLLHMRHIYKNHEVISRRDEPFVYSGCYLRKSGREGRKYIVMNNKSILRDEFLLFSCSSNENTDWYRLDRQTLYIETIFSRSCALFKREILQYADDSELSVVSDNVHMYLACCALIKADEIGRFTFALTTGYWGDSVPEAEQRVFGYSRRNWLSDGRSAKTYIKEFNEIFFKYTFETYPSKIRQRNFNGEVTWFDEVPPPPPVPPISWKRKLARAAKKVIPKPIKEIIKKCEYA